MKATSSAKPPAKSSTWARGKACPHVAIRRRPAFIHCRSRILSASSFRLLRPAAPSCSAGRSARPETVSGHPCDALIYRGSFRLSVDRRLAGREGGGSGWLPKDPMSWDVPIAATSACHGQEIALRVFLPRNASGPCNIRRQPIRISPKLCCTAAIVRYFS